MAGKRQRTASDGRVAPSNDQDCDPVGSDPVAALAVGVKMDELLARMNVLPHGSDSASSLAGAQCALQHGSHAEARDLASAVLEAGWKALHTGHWTNVDVAWRAAYALAALISTAASELEQRNLRTLDLGLMLGDASFRAELLKAAELLEESIAAQHHRAMPAPPSTRLLAPRALPTPRPLSGTLPALPRLRLPSLAFFYNECMVPAVPAVLTHVIDGWPAYTTRPWADLDYLKATIGHRTVPVETGAHYLADDFDEKLMTFAEYVERHIEPPPPPPGVSRAYLAQHQLFEQCPKLKRDIVMPDYCLLSLDDDDDGGDDDGDDGGDDGDDRGDGGDDGGGGKVKGAACSGGRRGREGVRVNAWFGPAGTLSPLHYDPCHNLLCQVVGSKYVRLHHPDQSRDLYPREAGPHIVSSQIIDPDAVDTVAFPRFSSVPYVDLVLAAGEAVYIPPGWWHMIESREVSWSVSFWWN